MKFKKTLTIRAISHVVLAILGGVVGVFAVKTEAEDAIMYFGFALAFASTVQFGKVIRLIGKPDEMRVRAVAEKDERNINIMLKAKSLAISLYIVIATIAIIGFMTSGKIWIASVIAWCVAVYYIIYIISYFVLSKKM